MSCSLFDVGVGSKRTCKPTAPGTGNKVYFFDIDECFPTKIPLVKEDTNFYDWDELLNGDDDNPGIAGHLYGVRIKPLTGHPTGTREEGRKYVTQQFEGQVVDNIDEFQALDAKIPYINLGMIVSDNAGNVYVYMSPYQELLYSSNFDGGTDTSTEAVTTFTCKYTNEMLSCKSDIEDGINLDQYLASKAA